MKGKKYINSLVALSLLFVFSLSLYASNNLLDLNGSSIASLRTFFRIPQIVYVQKHDNMAIILKEPQKIYVIRYEHNLGGEKVMIGKGSKLIFQGGSLKNGVVVGNGASWNKDCLFQEITFCGSFKLDTIYTRNYRYSEDNNLFANLSVLGKSPNETNIYFEERDYYVSVTKHGQQVFDVPSHCNLYLSGRIMLKSNEFTTFNILGLNSVSNINIYGGEIFGDIESHIDRGGEWGHNIHLSGCKNIIIIGTKSCNAWGDGLGIDSSGDTRSENIEVSGMTIKDCRRQGISIEGAKGVNVDKCIISGIGSIKHTSPSAAIDVEPWRTKEKKGKIIHEYAENITIKNCVSYNNLVPWKVYGYYKNVKFINCKSNTAGNLSGESGSDVAFIDCEMPLFWNLKGSARYKFKNCKLGILAIHDNIKQIRVEECDFELDGLTDYVKNYFGGFIYLDIDSSDGCDYTISRCYFNGETESEYLVISKKGKYNTLRKTNSSFVLKENEFNAALIDESLFKVIRKNK